jgi:hypothetical protein
VTKPRVYWRPELREDFDPADSCWAVSFGNVSLGCCCWAHAYQLAWFTAALERLESEDHHK